MFFLESNCEVEPSIVFLRNVREGSVRGPRHGHARARAHHTLTNYTDCMLTAWPQW